MNPDSEIRCYFPVNTLPLSQIPSVYACFISSRKIPCFFAVKFPVIVRISEFQNDRNEVEAACPTPMNAKPDEGSVPILLESLNSNNLLNFRWRGCVSSWQVETFSPHRKEAAAGTDTCVHGTVRLPRETGNGS